jgi:hypothetical protein
MYLSLQDRDGSFFLKRLCSTNFAPRQARKKPESSVSLATADQIKKSSNSHFRIKSHPIPFVLLRVAISIAVGKFSDNFLSGNNGMAKVSFKIKDKKFSDKFEHN